MLDLIPAKPKSRLLLILSFFPTLLELVLFFFRIRASISEVWCFVGFLESLKFFILTFACFVPLYGQWRSQLSSRYLLEYWEFYAASTLHSRITPVWTNESRSLTNRFLSRHQLHRTDNMIFIIPSLELNVSYICLATMWQVSSSDKLLSFSLSLYYVRCILL